MDYEVVIGLEVHTQLSTKSKAFCGCSTKFGAEPNSQVCPVCLGLPGVLPVLNEEYLNLGIKVALALNCTISKVMKFDRKNYYYPDLPKNFQISQYDMPLAEGGSIEIEEGDKISRIGIKRVHMEEDAGKLIHPEEGDYSLVDLNRTGIPLLEIVSEPDIRSADQAYRYLVSLKAILEYLGVSDCNMEEGSLRCDANISIRPKGKKALGVKVEIKNMNSFKGVKAALNFEEARQAATLKEGKKIIQETRLWDATEEKTVSMRTKEEAHDYRYFPEPDLVPFEVEGKRIKTLKAALPELPDTRMRRFQKEYEISKYDASVLVSDKAMADYFEECLEHHKEPKAVANWITQDLAASLSAINLNISELKVPARNLASLVEMISSGVLSGKIAKEVLKVMIETGQDPKKIVKEKGLVQMSSEDDLKAIVLEVMNENGKSVQDYKSGKTQVMGFLVGQVMKKTKGKANPKVLNEILQKELKKERI